MSAQNEHLRRRDYSSLTAALLDSERCLSDLVNVIVNPAALWPEQRDVEFLAKRARQLVTASRIAAEQEGA